MGAPQKDGHSLREHLQMAASMGSIEAEREMESPGIPHQAAYLWDWFGELNSARGAGGFGPSAIGYADIAAWARLTGRQIEPWEVRWLRALDRVWLSDPEKKP